MEWVWLGSYNPKSGDDHCQAWNPGTPISTTETPQTIVIDSRYSIANIGPLRPRDPPYYDEWD